MLCMECGAEMRLVEVAKANTMPVSGFEHRTWQCSGCSAVEQRMTFTREKTPAKTEPVEPTRAGSLQTLQTAPVGKVQAEPPDPPQADRIAPAESVPVQPAQTAPAQTVQTKPAGRAQTDRAKATATVPVKSTQTATVEPLQSIRRTHPETPGVAPQMNARVKALEEKVRNFRERVAAARAVADNTKRRAQFKRNRDNELRPVTSASEPRKTGSHINTASYIKTANPIKLDETMLSPTEPIRFRGAMSADESLASSAPISAEGPIAVPSRISAEEPVPSPPPISACEPIAPVSYTSALTKARMTLGGLVRAIAPKGFSRVR